jgi:hypothetical protein
VKTIIFAALTAVISFSMSTSARAQTAEQQLDQLGARLEVLRSQARQTSQAAQAILVEERRLDAEETRLRTEETQVVAAYERSNNEIERHSVQVNQHNSTCGGESTDEAFVNRCNQRAADLNQWRSAAQARRREADQRANVVLRQAEVLQEQRTAVSQRRTENTEQATRLRDEIGAVQSAISTLRANLDLSDLQAREARSAECLRLTDIYAMQQCMQSVFDGARR